MDKSQSSANWPADVAALVIVALIVMMWFLWECLKVLGEAYGKAPKNRCLNIATAICLSFLLLTYLASYAASDWLPTLSYLTSLSFLALVVTAKAVIVYVTPLLIEQPSWEGMKQQALHGGW